MRRRVGEATTISEELGVAEVPLLSLQEHYWGCLALDARAKGGVMGATGSQSILGMEGLLLKCYSGSRLPALVIEGLSSN